MNPFSCFPSMYPSSSHYITSFDAWASFHAKASLGLHFARAWLLIWFLLFHYLVQLLCFHGFYYTSNITLSNFTIHPLQYSISYHFCLLWLDTCYQIVFLSNILHYYLYHLWGSGRCTRSWEKRRYVANHLLSHSQQQFKVSVLVVGRVTNEPNSTIQKPLDLNDNNGGVGISLNHFT